MDAYEPLSADNVNFALWSDDPAEVDLLAFDAVAATVADVLLDAALDPVALGLSGSWGSGKTTVLGLVEAELNARSRAGSRVLVIQTDPWRYDPAVGAKESLIGEVLGALAGEVEAAGVEEDVKGKARRLARRLVQRIDWAKAIKLTAKTSLAFQIPSVDEIVDLVKPRESDGDAEPAARGLDDFRAEFQELVDSEALAHISAVVVLVDDLDRCLPPTVIETLEAIRLFLAVPRMSFVIAADEDRVADAIATRFRETGAPQEAAEEGEDPSRLYLHKIVQTTIPVPALSRFDTQAYLLLLQLQQTLGDRPIAAVIAECGRVRREGGALDDIKVPEGVQLFEQMAFASRMTPILYEKLSGSPRRIKRFLNDLRVRQAIAERRGIALQATIVAKLMVLERLLPRDFDEVLRWLAQGSLRDKLASLEAAAGRAGALPPTKDEATEERAGDNVAPEEATKTKVKAADKVSSIRADARAGTDDAFTEGMLRWAKLPPALSGEDISPYLYLAAAFAGAPLLDEALPERLRDIAANLLSRRDQRSVTEEDLRAMPTNEAESLLMHLGRTVRDQPAKQIEGVTAIVRLAAAQPDRAATAAHALGMIPPEDLRPGTALLFSGDQPEEITAVLRRWHDGSERGAIKEALRPVLEGT